jgi:lipoprotein NlpD
LRSPRSIVSLCLCVLLLGACADIPDDGPPRYVVLPADTLYSIAWRHDLDFRDLARWNDIGSDFHISVGQVLVLGPGGIPAARSTKPAAGPSTRPQAAKNNSWVARAKVGTGSGPPIVTGKWIWPTDRQGTPRETPGGGILLTGRLGQDVLAASAGRVVYTGSGLRGYGNLIIIKHADSLLSAYGHNREMLVHEGQDVALGQVIGHMGQGDDQSAVLYFEIRRNGKPVDPLPYLNFVR